MQEKIDKFEEKGEENQSTNENQLANDESFREESPADLKFSGLNEESDVEADANAPTQVLY